MKILVIDDDTKLAALIRRGLAEAGISSIWNTTGRAARDTTDDTVRGLDASADEYVHKPFVFAELESASPLDHPATRDAG